MSVETVAYMAMLRRMIRAAGPRVADADEEELALLFGLHEEIERAIDVAVDGQRARVSWTGIGAATGVSRQAARQRYERRRRRQAGG